MGLGEVGEGGHRCERMRTEREGEQEVGQGGRERERW